MQVDWIPIEYFVTETYRSPAVQKLVDTWNVEPEVVVNIVIGYFREMGIYKVSYVNQRFVIDSMRQYLLVSPEIRSLIKKARRENQTVRKHAG